MITNIHNQINSLNTEHTEYMNYIQTCKNQIAAALTNEGVETSEQATFETMAENISEIFTERTKLDNDVAATADNITEGKQAYVNGELVTGTVKQKVNPPVINTWVRVLRPTSVFYQTIWNVTGCTSMSFSYSNATEGSLRVYIYGSMDNSSYTLLTEITNSKTNDYTIDISSYNYIKIYATSSSVSNTNGSFSINNVEFI